MNTEELAAIFKALSEPIRLRILRLLLVKDALCVCELVSVLGISQSVISRHLAYLRNQELVSSRREGVWMYYQITEKASSELSSVLLLIQDTQSCPNMQTDLERLEQVNEGCN